MLFGAWSPALVLMSTLPGASVLACSPGQVVMPMLLCASVLVLSSGLVAMSMLLDVLQLSEAPIFASVPLDTPPSLRRSPMVDVLSKVKKIRKQKHDLISCENKKQNGPDDTPLHYHSNLKR